MNSKYFSQNIELIFVFTQDFPLPPASYPLQKYQVHSSNPSPGSLLQAWTVELEHELWRTLDRVFQIIPPIPSKFSNSE